MENPYDVLGVSEGDDKDKIRKVFESKLRKYQYLQREGKYTDGLHREFLKLNEAYELIMGIREKEDEQEKLPGGILARKWYNIRKWLDNYWYHNKILVVFVAVLMLFAVAFFTLPQFQLKKTILISVPQSNDRRYREQMEEVMTSIVKESLPYYDNVDISFNSNASENNNSGALKSGGASSLLASFDFQDILIVDRQSFDRLAREGKLVKLDSMAENICDDDENVLAKAESDTEEHIYGVRLNGKWVYTEALKGVWMGQNYELIAAINSESGKPKDCLKVIQKMVE